MRRADPRIDAIEADDRPLNAKQDAILPVRIHSQPHLEFFELLHEPFRVGMDMFGFIDAFHLLATIHVVVGQHRFVGRQVRAVDNQELVLVQLDFLRDVWIAAGGPPSALAVSRTPRCPSQVRPCYC